MVKRFVLVIISLILIAVFSTLFLSKERMCDTVIDTIASKNITVCYRKSDFSVLGCKFEDLDILFSHSRIADIQTLEWDKTLLIANKIRLHGLLEKFFPPSIASISCNLISGEITSQGLFGTLKGHLSLGKRTLEIVLRPSRQMRKHYRTTLKYFKKTPDGYKYVLAF